MKLKFTAKITLCMLAMLTLFQAKASAEDYYLVSDWDGWTRTNKNFKLTPTGNDNEYSICISADYYGSNKTAGTDVSRTDYSLNFKVTSGTNITNNSSNSTTFYSNCICPSTSTSNTTVNATNASGTGAKGSSYGAWYVKGIGNNSSGNGYYTLTINVSTLKWTITANTQRNVAYFMSSHNGWTSTEYLFEKADNNDDGNYYGKVYLEPGMTFKFCDGFSWYGYSSGDWKTVSFSGSVNNTVPSTIPAGYYYIEANPTRDIQTSDYDLINTVTVRPKYKVTADGTYADMTYDATSRAWYANSVAVGNSETVYVSDKEVGTDGNYSDVTYTQDNDANGTGTYKVIFYEKDAASTGVATEKLLLSNDLAKITNSSNTVFIRSFSDYYPRIIPSGLTAYYATGYTSSTTSLGMTKISDGIIPANTGVVLIYDGSTTGLNFDAKTTSGVQTAETVSLEKATSAGTAPSTNYFNAEPTWVSLAPTTKDANGNITYRNYYLANLTPTSSSSDVLGFYRIISETGDGTVIRKAYLALPASIQSDASNDDMTYLTSSQAKPVYFAFSGDDNTTGINDIQTTESDDNTYYNIQGMKINKPTKGMYIHNGKKYVVK